VSSPVASTADWVVNARSVYRLMASSSCSENRHRWTTFVRRVRPQCPILPASSSADTVPRSGFAD
jgi:hypothetical protein